ncbi:MAG: prepilin-type N-terminal cleavage/methylation domain-containing protein [Oscillospiraceae bacterium]|nr:prepilin-type N-terminal cleavage/methylation domain-containing protein [Oscillospiraceae bacterium]
MKKILKNKKGTTLVELLVAMLLFVIVTTSASTIMFPMLKLQIGANEYAEYNTLLDTVANYIISEFSGAVPDGTPIAAGSNYLGFFKGTGTAELTVVPVAGSNSGGILHRNGRPVLHEDYYKMKTVGFFCRDVSSVYAGTAFELTVFVYDRKGSEVINRVYAVRPLALNQYIEDF